MKNLILCALIFMLIPSIINAQEPFVIEVEVNSESKFLEIVQVGEKYYLSLDDLITVLPNSFKVTNGSLSIVTNNSKSTINTNTAPKTSPSSYSTVESRIDGEFNGWTGDTLFKLTNGQIWQQAEYNYKYVYKYSPKVKIVNTSSGWIMTVEGVDKSIKVKRLQ